MLRLRNSLLPAALFLSAAGFSFAGEARGDVLISGTLSPAAKIKSVAALDRDLPQKPAASVVDIRTIPGKFSPASGTFVIENLSGSRTWDLQVTLTDGTIIEGVDIRPAAASDKPLEDKDRESITKLLARMQTHEDEKRFLTVAGNGEQATALVELLRTRPDHYDLGKGQKNYTWRVEIWRYEKKFGAWHQDDRRQVLRRFKTPVEEFDKWTWVFEPALGGIDLKKGEARRDVVYAVPEKLDASLGRRKGERLPAGAEPVKTPEE
jgi:hypothetical protein